MFFTQNETTVKGNKTSQMEFLELILRLALYEEQRYNTFDAMHDLPHFAINLTTFTYWT